MSTYPYCVTKMMVLIQAFPICESVNENEQTEFSTCDLFYCITYSSRGFITLHVKG